MAASWNEVFRKYDRNDLSFRNAFIAQGYKSIHTARDELEDLAYYASFVCAIAVAFRKNGVDLTSLALRTQSPPPPHLGWYEDANVLECFGSI